MAHPRYHPSHPAEPQTRQPLLARQHANGEVAGAAFIIRANFRRRCRLLNHHSHLSCYSLLVVLVADN